MAMLISTPTSPIHTKEGDFIVLEHAKTPVKVAVGSSFHERLQQNIQYQMEFARQYRSEQQKKAGKPQTTKAVSFDLERNVSYAPEAVAVKKLSPIDRLRQSFISIIQTQ